MQPYAFNRQEDEHYRKLILILSGVVVTLLALSALLLSGTFGLLSSSSAGQTDKFTAGKVTLTKTATAKCTIGATAPLQPGDKSSGYTLTTAHRTDATFTPCTFTVKYTGTVKATLGLDIALAGTAGTSTPHVTGLYTGKTPTTAKSLRLKVTSTGSAAITYTLATLTAYNSHATDLLIAKTVTPGKTNTFTVNFALPRAATNKYQGAKTTVTLSVLAVQSGNNHPSSGCATAGKKCTTITWS